MNAGFEGILRSINAYIDGSLGFVSDQLDHLHSAGTFSAAIALGPDRRSVHTTEAPGERYPCPLIDRDRASIALAVDCWRTTFSSFPCRASLTPRSGAGREIERDLAF